MKRMLLATVLGGLMAVSLGGCSMFQSGGGIANPTISAEDWQTGRPRSG